MTSEPYAYEHEVPEWGKPVKFLLVEEFNVYQSALAIRADKLEANRACLEALIPMFQQALVDYSANPGPVNDAIVKYVAALEGGGFVMSAGQAADSSKKQIELELVSNAGNDDDRRLRRGARDQADRRHRAGLRGARTSRSRRTWCPRTSSPTSSCRKASPFRNRSSPCGLGKARRARRFPWKDPMTWWIETMPPSDATGTLKEAYDWQAASIGEPTEFTQLGSLYPDLVLERLRLYKVVEGAPSNLSARGAVPRRARHVEHQRHRPLRVRAGRPARRPGDAGAGRGGAPARPGGRRPRRRRSPAATDASRRSSPMPSS